MPDNDRPVLVVGATGFLGRRLVAALLDRGHRVRCLVRDSRRAADLAGDRTEIVEGDMLDTGAVRTAVEGCHAVYICVHTISRQSTSDDDRDFVDVERTGIENIVAAAHALAVRRILYVTAIGVAPDAVSTWSRGRFATEQVLFRSGLDVSVIRPGMIVGRGGAGFAAIARGARSRVSFVFASRTQRFRTIAVDDLAHELVQLLDDTRSYGRHLDTGSDDVLTMGEMIDIAADHLGRRRPLKVHLPRRALARAAPLIDRLSGMPRGAMGGFVGPGADADLIGDPTEIRSLLERQPRSYRESLVEALGARPDDAGDAPS